jgi:uncharacterized 2Fe-2S/4Fe-4S cluster protein (DUF4445 family)
MRILLDVSDMTIDHLDHVEINLQPIGRRISIPIGITILEASQIAGIELSTICGGTGTCGGCKIRLLEGEISPINPTELELFSGDEIESGFRLACQAKILSSVRIEIPPESLTTSQRLQIEGREIELSFDPVVIRVDISLTAPDLHDLRADYSRIKEYLQSIGYSNINIRFPTLREISTQLRAHHWEATLAIKGNEIIAILPKGNEIYGIAVDVGTTKLAAYLVDLSNGNTVSKRGAMNPQISYGEDVISRIGYVNNHEDGTKILQSRLVDTLNDLISQLVQEADISNHQIVEAVIVGNTAMHHLFAGLPVHQLGTAPYVPVISDALEIPVFNIGLDINRGATIYLPPNVAGYVGADHVAMLLAAKAAEHRQDAHTIVSLDIGTNTEISLYHWGRHLSCSCASGPAFEGAHIREGMRAAPGAIERVRLNEKQVQIKTIGNIPPVGICGSGILDTVSELLTHHVIDARGVFIGEHPKLHRINGKYEFILASAEESGHGRNVVVTRHDVNEIQLAKGAIRAGVEVLLDEAGITDSDIDEFIIAGAFGTYLDLESAIRIGMFPDLPRNRFQQIGNAAGLGAKALLISKGMRTKADQIVEEVEYIELTTQPGFTDAYMEALAFN